MTAQLELWESVANDDSPVTFRPIHYLGSKFRLLADIESAVQAVAPSEGTACDLFSGSGVVAARLARTHRVVAVDIQEYSRVLSSALLHPAPLSAEDTEEVVSKAREIESGGVGDAFEALLEHERTCVTRAHDGDPEALCNLLEHGSLLAFEHGQGPAHGELSSALARTAQQLRLTGTTVNGEPPLAQYFGGIYFSYDQAFGLQCALAACRSLPAESRDAGVAAVLSTASEIVTTVGNHFAQPIRPRDRAGRPKQGTLVSVGRRRSVDAIALFARWLDRYSKLPPADKTHEAVRADYRDFLASYNGELAVVYADPPYTRDHYSRFYHVLETLARQDDPGVSSTRIGGQTRLSRGLYRAERHQSAFCIKSQAPGAFADLFSGVRRFDVPLVLSYSPYDANGRNRPRLMMVDDIVRLARPVFRRVDVFSTSPIAHSKLNAAHLNASPPREAEVLIVCAP
jgi:D12 class N6 adenine-specific DNA methyltransferase